MRFFSGFSKVVSWEPPLLFAASPEEIELLDEKIKRELQDALSCFIGKTNLVTLLRRAQNGTFTIEGDRVVGLLAVYAVHRANIVSVLCRTKSGEDRPFRLSVPL